MEKLFGKGSEYKFKDVVYNIPPFVLDIQAEYEKYFKSLAWSNLREQRKFVNDEEYDKLLNGLRKDIDSGEYDFEGKTLSKGLDSTKNQKRLAYLVLLYGNKDKGITKELIEEIYNTPNESRNLVASMEDANKIPNLNPPVS